MSRTVQETPGSIIQGIAAARRTQTEVPQTGSVARLVATHLPTARLMPAKIRHNGGIGHKQGPGTATPLAIARNKLQAASA